MGQRLRSALALACVCVVGLVGAPLAGHGAALLWGESEPRRPAPVGVVTEELVDWPAPAADQRDRPLDDPPPVPLRGRGYAFSYVKPNGEPAAYDPCRPIHYAVRETGKPEYADAVLDDAIDKVSAATGLRFVDDGPTDEDPTRQREPVQERYGDRWAPVLIAWTDPDEYMLLLGDVAGMAGSFAASDTGGEDDMHYVTGDVILDAPQLDTVARGPGGVMAVRDVVLHELGHLVGLDYVRNRGQLMHASSAVHGFRPGDLRGLAQLGSGECYPRG